MLHTIRISLDSDSNSCDEVALVDTVSGLLEVAPEDIMVLKVERSLLITRKLTGLILARLCCSACDGNAAGRWLLRPIGAVIVELWALS